MFIFVTSEYNTRKFARRWENYSLLRFLPYAAKKLFFLKTIILSNGLFSLIRCMLEVSLAFQDSHIKYVQTEIS